MKLNKSQFKKILKECIKELIVEGAFNSVITENLDMSQEGPVLDIGFDDKKVDFKKPAAPTKVISERYNAEDNRIQEMAKHVASSCAGGDAGTATMMEQILADTARTTLIAQREVSAGGKGGMDLGGVATPETDAADEAQLDMLSGGLGSKRWAAVAFANNNK